MKPLEQRLADAVARRLGAPVTFNRWVRDQRTGADRPVFTVPVDYVAQATLLGFAAWQFERSTR